MIQVVELGMNCILLNLEGHYHIVRRIQGNAILEDVEAAIKQRSILWNLLTPEQKLEYEMMLS